MRVPPSFVVLSVAACAPSPREPVVGSTAPSPAASAVARSTAGTPSAPSGASAPTVTSAAPATPAPPDAGPPPLQSGSPKGPSPFGSSSPVQQECSPARVLARLREVSDRCRANAGEVCGKISVASDAKDNRVRATFDVAGAGVEVYSQCVGQEVNSVTWGCALGAEPVSLDLGCDL